MGNSFSPRKRKDVDVSQGPPKKRKGDVVQIHGVINTPPVLGENGPSSSRQGTHVKYPVHELNPNCTSKNSALTIIFFHGIGYGNDDDWKQTWTTRPIDDKEECICWPQMWILKDLNDNVKILSLSYDSNVVASVHKDVTEIGRSLFKAWLQIQGMKLFGMDQWQWLLIVLEVLSSKAWWSKCTNLCIKSKQIIWMLKCKIVVRNF